MKVQLKGITWGHSRGVTPLLAVSQRFMEQHPGIEITWDQRSLQSFADMPIEQLTDHYDLLVIDHPWVGTAAKTGCVLPLDSVLEPFFLENQKENSVGRSYESYLWAGHIWALPIDAATPVACYRPDLLPENKIPVAWKQVLEMAGEGKVVAPGVPIDLLMNFYSFCLSEKAVLFEREDEIVSARKGQEALISMRELYRLLPDKVFSYNPIAVMEEMSRSDEFWYCPFAYGYSNYARSGYGDYALKYADVVAVNGTKLSTTLGGTGLSVSAVSTNRHAAAGFLQYALSEKIQKTLYVQTGGQPGHLKAWKDPVANSLTDNYFLDTLPALERSYLRPRYHGYLYFQDRAGDPLQHFLRKGGNPESVLNELNRIYRESRKLEEIGSFQSCTTHRTPQKKQNGQ